MHSIIGKINKKYGEGNFSSQNRMRDVLLGKKWVGIIVFIICLFESLFLKSCLLNKPFLLNLPIETF